MFLLSSSSLIVPVVFLGTLFAVTFIFARMTSPACIPPELLGASILIVYLLPLPLVTNVPSSILVPLKIFTVPVPIERFDVCIGIFIVLFTLETPVNQRVAFDPDSISLILPPWFVPRYAM